VKRIVVPVVLLVALALVPKLTIDIPYVFKSSINTPGTLQLLALCLLFGGLAMTYDLLFGFTGLLSFGHALYFAVGVYIVAIALTKWHWTFAEGLAFTALVGIVLPLVLGAVSLRVGGIAFAMVTLAFAQAGSILAFKNPYGWTGGEEGLGNDYTKLPAGLVGIFNTKHLYWVALGYLAVVFAVVQWAVSSSPGHIWQAIRENELRVEVLGLRPYAYKLMSFVLASFLATAGGVVYVLLLGGATPDVTSANFTLTLLVMVVIGGTGTRWGARGLVPPACPADAARAAALRAWRALHPRRVLRAGRPRADR
jgi:branched-chain amino acid transport system permease protein